MKVYKDKPTRETMVVEVGEHEYEIYMLVPVLLGGCRWLGTQRVEDDSRRVFTNIDSVTRSYLEAQGEDELAKQVQERMESRYHKKRASAKAARVPSVVQLTMEQLLDHGCHRQVLEDRKLDRSKVTMATVFTLTAQEIKKYGIKLNQEGAK